MRIALSGVGSPTSVGSRIYIVAVLLLVQHAALLSSWHLFLSGGVFATLLIHMAAGRCVAVMDSIQVCALQSALCGC